MIDRMFVAAGLLMFCAMAMGTTYVIMEGDKEVGRFVEDDGVNRVETIRSEAQSKKGPTTVDLPLESIGIPEDSVTSQDIRAYGEKFRLMDATNYMPWVQFMVAMGIGALGIFLMKRKFLESEDLE